MIACRLNWWVPSEMVIYLGLEHLFWITLLFTHLNRLTMIYSFISIWVLLSFCHFYGSFRFYSLLQITSIYFTAEQSSNEARYTTRQRQGSNVIYVICQIWTSRHPQENYTSKIRLGTICAKVSGKSSGCLAIKGNKLRVRAIKNALLLCGLCHTQISLVWPDIWYVPLVTRDLQLMEAYVIYIIFFTWDEVSWGHFTGKDYL